MFKIQVLFREKKAKVPSISSHICRNHNFWNERYLETTFLQQHPLEIEARKCFPMPNLNFFPSHFQCDNIQFNYFLEKWRNILQITFWSAKKKSCFSVVYFNWAWKRFKIGNFAENRMRIIFAKKTYFFAFHFPTFHAFF